MGLLEAPCPGGARFAFVPLKSGRCHVRPHRASHRPHVTPRQREVAIANWQAGRPLFSGSMPQTSRREVRKIAFISPHCLIDSSNGAATGTLDQLRLLQQMGFECEAFCAARVDRKERPSIQQVLTGQAVRYEVRRAASASSGPAEILAVYRGIPVSVFAGEVAGAEGAGRAEAKAFLAGVQAFLERSRPDAVLTYGGDPVCLALFDLIKSRDIPLVFALHNFAYSNPRTFRPMDYVIVPTEYCREYYWREMGLASQKLPLPIDRERAAPKARSGACLTFVNPSPHKGVYGLRGSRRSWLGGGPTFRSWWWKAAAGWTASTARAWTGGALGTLRVMENTPDPWRFFATTRVLLVPSLFLENVGLTACEAMLNGIPVVASTRGGLPEVVGDAGFVFDIPARYTPDSRDLPAVEEVGPSDRGDRPALGRRRLLRSLESGRARARAAVASRAACSGLSRFLRQSSPPAWAAARAKGGGRGIQSAGR